MKQVWVQFLDNNNKLKGTKKYIEEINEKRNANYEREKTGRINYDKLTDEEFHQLAWNACSLKVSKNNKKEGKKEKEYSFKLIRFVF